MLGEEPAPAANLQDQSAPSQNRLEVGEHARGARVRVEAEALVMNLGKGGSVVTIPDAGHDEQATVWSLNLVRPAAEADVSA